MSKSGKFGYLIGYSLGFILIYGLYLIGIVAMFIDLWNRQLPIIPIILILSVAIWRKLLQISVVLNINAQINEARNLLLSQQSNRNREVEAMMSKIKFNQYGGPN